MRSLEEVEASIARLLENRRNKKRGARYLRSLRRNLVRVAGDASMSLETKRRCAAPFYAAMGIRVPRSLRQDLK